MHADGHQRRGPRLADLSLQSFQAPGKVLEMLGVPLVLVRRKCTDSPNHRPPPPRDRELGAPGCRWTETVVRGKGKASRQEGRQMSKLDELIQKQVTRVTEREIPHLAT